MSVPTVKLVFSSIRAIINLAIAEQELECRNSFANTLFPIVVHDIRHAMRDRLRVVSCPLEKIDQIGGWVTAGLGHSYGEGYGLLNTTG